MEISFLPYHTGQPNLLSSSYLPASVSKWWSSTSPSLTHSSCPGDEYWRCPTGPRCPKQVAGCAADQWLGRLRRLEKFRGNVGAVTEKVAIPNGQAAWKHIFFWGYVCLYIYIYIYLYIYINLYMYIYIYKSIYIYIYLYIYIYIFSKYQTYE